MRAAFPVQLPDVVLLHPPPRVLRVPVRGTLHHPAYVFPRAAAYQRLPARVHPQEGGHVIHPGPQQHPAGVLGAVAGHLPLREEAGGRGRRHPGRRGPPGANTEHREENRDTSSGEPDE